MSARSALALAAIALVACDIAAPKPALTVDPSAPVIVPYAVAGGGEIRFTVQPRYLVGEPVVFELDITAGSAEIRGPLSGSVLASGMETGAQIVRRIQASDLPVRTVRPGERVHTTVTWDGRNDSGGVVDGRTYSVSFEFVIGGETRRLGTVIEVRAR